MNQLPVQAFDAARHTFRPALLHLEAAQPLLCQHGADPALMSNSAYQRSAAGPCRMRRTVFERFSSRPGEHFRCRSLR